MRMPMLVFGLLLLSPALPREANAQPKASPPIGVFDWGTRWPSLTLEQVKGQLDEVGISFVHSLVCGGSRGGCDWQQKLQFHQAGWIVTIYDPGELYLVRTTQKPGAIAHLIRELTPHYGKPDSVTAAPPPGQYAVRAAWQLPTTRLTLATSSIAQGPTITVLTYTPK
jgi:hypothetical protein